MIARALGALAAAVVLTVIFSAAPAQAASPAPAWSVSSLATPTNFVPGDETNDYSYDVRIANLGAAPTDGNPITIVDTLPAGLTVKNVDMELRSFLTSEGKFDYGPFACEIGKAGEVETVTCSIYETLPEAKEPALLLPAEERRLVIHVSTPLSAKEGESLTNHVEVHGGGAPSASVDSHSEVSAAPASQGFSYFRAGLTGADGKPIGQAASHPFQYTTSFAVNTKFSPPGNEAAFVPAGGDIKDIQVTLPPGLVGNPTAATPCTAQQFTTTHTVTLGEGGTNSFFTGNDCPNGSAVGLVLVQQIEGIGGILPVPLYNLVPPPGMPAQFGAQILNLPFYIDTEVRPDEDYKVVATLRNATQVKRLTAATVVIWGTPANESHNLLRGSCLDEVPEVFPLSLGNCPAGITPKPFLRLPTNCASSIDIAMSFDTWTDPGSFLAEASKSPAPSGCASLPFTPAISLVPTTTVADSPSGLAVNIHLPQNEDPNGLATADLRDLTVTLPKGVSVNPASAAGLVGCSPAQLELHGPKPAQCPDASKIGTVEVHTPLLDHPIDGAVYVASQNDNPFGSLLAIYVTAFDKETGVVLKLAGKVEPDPSTGQLKTTFTNNPQLPFEDLTTVFFEGPRAPLRTPLTCGRYTTSTDMTPWSAPDSGPDATPSDSFDVTTAPGGGACASSEAAAPNKPSFRAGTVTPIAGSFSPFVFDLDRPDGSQYLHGIDVTLPPGLVGKLAGIPYCPEATLVAAAGKAGRVEQSSPSCPAKSQVGSVDVAAGAGPSPIHVGGKAYLAGPYKGAPLSLAVITPAVAGPFDLGTVVVRAALRVDPRTAQVTAVSDPLPTILQGIPLDLRSVSLAMDRPGFMLNPTDCEPMSIGGREISLANQVAPLASRFQVGACAALGFEPKLGLRLTGGGRRGAHPQLRAVLQPRAGDANIASAVVGLPHSEFLDQAHIKTVCTRVQFAAHACPAGSVYGHAVATTPLLDEPLEGPVYLRSSDHKLPDLVMALHGQIDVELSGRIDSVHGGIRTSFETVPDAPVTKFVLSMKGGKKGLLINSRNVCAGSFAASADFGAQNGRAAALRPALKNSTCPKQRHRAPSHRRGTRH